MRPIQETVNAGRRLAVRRWVPYAVLVLTCLWSIAASVYVTATMDSRNQAAGLVTRARFLNDAEGTRLQIEVRLNTYIEVIRAGAALLAASNEISPLEFRSFVAGLNLHERFPGMQAMGFAERVAAADLKAFRKMVDLDGARTLRDWTPDQKTEYAPVVYLEPEPWTAQTGVPLDLSDNPIISEAMDRARDTGQPAASAKFAEDAFMVIAPVYRLRAPLTNAADRHEALVGYVFSPFSARRFLAKIASEITAPVAFEVHDGVSSSGASLLSAPLRGTDDAPDKYARAVQAAGRPWLVIVRPTEPLTSRVSHAGRWTLAGGLALSFLLFLVTYGQLRAWETVAQQEAELRKSEQALRKSEAAAQAAGRTKDEFLATLSHELRTPLNAILGWVSLLRAGTLEEDRRAHALAVIERNAHLQSELIEDLLDVSRIVMGKIRLQLQRLDLTSIATSAVESLRPAADAKGVRLQMTTPPAPLMMRGDAERLQQVIRNLVSNAVKFTPAGGHVQVELAGDQTKVQLSVRDTGIGISSDFLPHVFERFRQADSSSTRPHAGLGLGLSIVKDLVELQGGVIQARSNGLNQGAEFLLRFPPATGAEETMAPAAAVRESAVPADLTGVRVLVIDDDPGTRELLREALGAAGAKVLLGHSADEALRVLTSTGADVMVSDIGMPDQDGLALIRRVRSLTGEIARIPAIALTAYAGAADRERVIEAGYDAHFSKPADLAMLQLEIARLLGARSAV